MIFDELKNIDFYKTLGIGDRYAKAIDWLKTQDLASLADGKYEVDGKDVYVSIQSYDTIPWEEAKYEAHENYTDIQYIISGTEVMGYAPVETLTPTGPYNPDKDVIKFDNAVPGQSFVVRPGEYMIFFPWDGHKPKAMDGASAAVKKAVVKIREK
ncbi:MAG: YhcH/YjgK/YiaL family protein [Clostridiales bacterium]|nr:YhcH/YjgK/YiaL family protein [Clostridiales bacterium]